MGCSQSAPSDTAPQSLTTPPPTAAKPPPPQSPSPTPQQPLSSSSSPRVAQSDNKPPPPPPPAQPTSSLSNKTASVAAVKGPDANYVNTENSAANSIACDKIQPNVGYVVKTMNILDNEELEKLFLNVMHHEGVSTFVTYKNCDAKKRTIYNIVIPTKLYTECEKDDALKLNISCQAIDHLNEHYQLKADTSQCVFIRSKFGYFAQ